MTVVKLVVDYAVDGVYCSLPFAPTFALSSSV